MVKSCVECFHKLGCDRATEAADPSLDAMRGVLRPKHLPRPSVTFDSDPETGVIRFVLVSNGSLSRTQAHGVLLALGLFMTLIAGGFWAQGSLAGVAIFRFGVADHRLCAPVESQKF